MNDLLLEVWNTMPWWFYLLFLTAFVFGMYFIFNCFKQEG